MNFKWDKKYLYWGITAFLVIISSISFFLAMSRLDEFSKSLDVIIKILNPILYGLVIGYLLTPTMNFFEKLLMKFFLLRREKISLKNNNFKNKQSFKFNIGKISRTIAIIITLLVSLLAISSLVSLIIPQLVTSIIGIVDNFDNYGNTIRAWSMEILADNPQLEKNFMILYENFSDYLEGIIKNDLLPQINNFLTGVTSGVLDVIITIKDLLIGIIISVYVMASKDIFAAQGKKILFALMKPQKANHTIETMRKTHRIFGGFISGKLLDSLIIGIICLICLNLLHMPYALLVSVIIGVTNIIPFFGPFIGAIPSAVLILLVDPVKCIYFIIFVLLLQQFDGNILGPKILGDSTGLSSFWVMFAILVSGGWFGFIGMVVGVPLFAVIYSMISESIEKSLKNKNMPTDTADYKNLKYVDEKTKDFVHLRYTMVNKTKSKK